MALVGLDGAWLRVNAALCEIIGWPAAELLATTFQDITRLEEVAEDVAVINELIAGNIPRCQIEKRVHTKAGEEMWVLLSLSLVRDHAGSPQHVIAQVQDIGERRRLAEELAAARDEALELSRAKSAFVANMSHEIRTPLNGVIGLADLMLDGELDEDQREYAEAIRTSGDALMAVISDVLDVSKIEAGKLELDDEDFDVRRVIDEACAIVAPTATEKQLELMAWVERDMPAVVRGDGNRVRQVLVNLLGNAVKFTERGEVVLGVSTRWTQGRPVVRFEVRDTGPGIESVELDGLFDAFTQAAGTSATAAGGTGLGLSICKQLVELMDGVIAAHSTPGLGSTFWFAVPLRQARGDVAASAGVELAGVRVLVADDNATNRTILSHQLAAWKMTCDCADGGAAALSLAAEAAAQGRPYTLALLDRNMPGMHQLELVRALRSSPALAAVGILVLSSGGGGREALRRAGVDGVLAKPVAHARLRDEIKRILGATAAPRRAPRRLAATAAALDTAPKVLLAEDNEINQLVAVNVLERCGYRVDLAHTGRQAVEMSRRERYQAIFMDCRLPELDGYSAASEIRRLESAGRHTPIIAITAHTMRGDREKCLAAGMDEYIAKPLRREALETVLRRALPAPAILDRSLIDEIDAPSAERIVKLFLGSARARVAEVAEATKRGDGEAVRRLAHGLKGAAASVGAVAVSRACDELSAASHRADPLPTTVALRRLERAVSDTESALSPHSRKAPR
jgi:PAS domain S-box-containing protein